MKKILKIANVRFLRRFIRLKKLAKKIKSPKIPKKFWIKLHTYLSLFFLPLALIYAITGVGYIYEIRQNSGAEIVKIPLESMPKKGGEKELILKLLEENSLEIPKDTSIKMFRGNPSMGNVYYGASIIKERNGEIILQVTKRNIYGVLLLMHKSNGSKFEVGGFKFHFFDFLAMGFGASLLLFYLSGLIMTSFCKKDRPVSFGVLGAGLVATILAVYFSV